MSSGQERVQLSWPQHPLIPHSVQGQEHTNHDNRV